MTDGPRTEQRDDQVHWLRQAVIDMKCDCAAEHLATLDRLVDALRDILDLKAGWTAIPASDAERLLDQADSFARKALEPTS